MVAMAPEHAPAAGTSLPHLGTSSKTSWDVSGHFPGRLSSTPANNAFWLGDRTSENFRLRAALTQAGMLPGDLAGRVEVDIKTVGRWLSGRTPHPRHRALVAQILAADEIELWPEAKPTRAAEDPFKELAGAWPDSEHTNAPDWLAMLDSASEQIDLLDPTLHGLITQPGVIEELAAKATRGACVRILIAAADSIYLTAQDQEVGGNPDDDDTDDPTPTQREHNQTIETLHPLINDPRIEIREFVTARPNTILRLDEQMLITLHLYGLTRPQAPVLHLRRRQDDGLFDQFAAHFDRIWNQAAEELELDTAPDDLIEDPQEAAQHTLDMSAPPTPQQAQQALERLRHRRTP